MVHVQHLTHQITIHLADADLIAVVVVHVVANANVDAMVIKMAARAILLIHY